MQFLTDENKRRFGDDYIKIIIQEIRRAGKSSSGKLINSLDYRIKDEGDVVGLAFEGEDYFEEVDKGRKAGSFPPIREIGNWARIKGIPQSAVFPIAKSIFKFGIKPTNIIEKANRAALNGQPFNELEEEIKTNVEGIVVNELNKLNKT